MLIFDELPLNQASKQARKQVSKQTEINESVNILIVQLLAHLSNHIVIKKLFRMVFKLHYAFNPSLLELENVEKSHLHICLMVPWENCFSSFHRQKIKLNFILS